MDRCSETGGRQVHVEGRFARREISAGDGHGAVPRANCANPRRPSPLMFPTCVPVHPRCVLAVFAGPFPISEEVGAVGATDGERGCREIAAGLAWLARIKAFSRLAARDAAAPSRSRRV
jgi:hypothetical protein